jgi:hypothetical protein
MMFLVDLMMMMIDHDRSIDSGVAIGGGCVLGVGPDIGERLIRNKWV